MRVLECRRRAEDFMRITIGRRRYSHLPRYGRHIRAMPFGIVQCEQIDRRMS